MRPSPEERARAGEAAARLLDALRAAARQRALPVEPLLVGSAAKDTWLRDHLDLDVFVLFPRTTPRDALERDGLALGRAVVPDGEERFAEHPYIRGTFQGYDAEVVPCYRVEHPDDRLSAVDRTPFHTTFVLGRLREGQRDEVLLLKQFLRGIGAYGADAAVEGFSGYLVELLALRFGTFDATLRAAARWGGDRTFLVLGTTELKREFGEPLVVVDPVDAGRNVAAAVAPETFRLFCEAAKAFLVRPRAAFFFPPERVLPPVEEIQRLAEVRGVHLALLRTPAPRLHDDTLAAQARRATRQVAAALERSGFGVLGSRAVTGDRAGCLVAVREAVLPATEEHAGPPLRSEEHARRFREKWEKDPDAASPVREEGGRLVVARRRTRRTLIEVLAHEVPGLNLGADLTPAFRRAYELAEGKDAVTAAPEAALELVDPRPPWER